MNAPHRLILVVWLLAGWAGSMEARTFTDTSGRTLNAEIVSATADNVTLKLDSGATHTLPLSRLSDADRGYVSGWLKANPGGSQPAAPAAAAAAVAATPARYAFTVTWQKEKTGEKPVRISAYGGSEEQWACKFKITNLSNVPLSDMELRYQIHLSLERDGKVALNEVATGKDTVGSLPRNQAVEISTKPVPLLKLKLDGGYITTDNSRSNKRDSIKGVAAGLFHKGVLVYEFRSQGVPVMPFTDDKTNAKSSK